MKGCQSAPGVFFGRSVRRFCFDSSIALQILCYQEKGPWVDVSSDSSYRKKKWLGDWHHCHI